MEFSTQTSGYAIVMKSHQAFEVYNSDPHITNITAQEYLKELREAFDFLDVKSYRGISRYPIKAESYYNDSIIKHMRDFEVEAMPASLKLGQLSNMDYWSKYNIVIDVDITDSIAQAREVLSLLKNKKDYEIIHLSRTDYIKTDRTLGFDIGYWGGDHFSLICDCSVMPMYHSPEPEDFNELSIWLRMLNKHLLFETSDDAESFRKYYMTKQWAEKEEYEGEFCIIQVDEILWQHQ
jgi:hypothetical protein